MGTLVLWMGFVASVVASVAYGLAALKKASSAALGRMFFFLVVVAAFGASAMLMISILSHQFQYAYIWGYSSRALPLELLVTTFWAGQEGSFLLWALFASVIGVFLQRVTRRERVEFEVMGVYTLVLAFLFLLMLVKSPFKMIWDEFPGEIAQGMAPRDGRGLNPLLQNFWMIIHPPVLFLGFAATAIPFSFAVGALWRKRYGDWLANAFPWVLFSSLALGAGLILGGYWAYGVLGWGGWWGWDPVENSSLVPWIVLVILIHTMVIQKRTGKLVRTNFALAVLSFVLVVYSTFLTRSGVLSEASVHSFVDPGALAYGLLVVWMAAVTLGGVGLLALRWKELKLKTGEVGLWTRESLLAVGSVAMGAGALIILFGTSLPLFSTTVVEPSFYDRMNLPVAIASTALLGLSLLVQWKMESASGLIRRSLVALVGAVFGTVLLGLVGLTDPVMMVLAFTSLFAFIVNVQRATILARQSPLFLGGVLSHVGLAMLLLGIIGSGRYGEKQVASLPLGQSRDVLGHTLTYEGSHLTEDGKSVFTVHVQSSQSSYILEPVMYRSDFDNNIMRTPDYATSLTGDFYIEPVSLEGGTASAGDQASEVITVRKGESVVHKGMTVTFVGFDMAPKDAEAMASGEGFPVGAVLTVTRSGASENLTAVSLFAAGKEPVTRVASTRDGSLGFEFLNMNVNTEGGGSAAQIRISEAASSGAAPTESVQILVIEASAKPVMSLVWIAALFVMVGLTISIMNAVRSASPGDGPTERRENSGAKKSREIESARE